MRTNLFALACLFAVFSYACSDTSGPTTTCGDGTQNVDGVCRTIVTCGEGTTNVNNTCEPTEGATCGAGTVEGPGGLCIPSETACTDGTHLDPATGACVPDFTVVCGAGTELGDDGTCVPSDVITCGPGTVRQESEDGSRTVCLPLCTDGEIFSEASDTCVDQCEPGTDYNGTTGTCQPRCVDDEFYVVVSDTCVHVPECLRNAFFGDVSGDCDGWPWNELSLDTVCARRAFHVCDSIFDSACGCESGGEAPIFQEPGEGVDWIEKIWERINESGRWEPATTQAEHVAEEYRHLADYGTCLVNNYAWCEGEGMMGVGRDLVDLGEVVVDIDALIDLDEHYAIDEGTCTRPVGWDAWPTELFAALFDGNIALDAECLISESCSPDAYCTPVEDHVHTPDDPTPWTCQPRVAAGDPCNNDGDGGCQEDLLCLQNGGGDWTCQGPRAVNSFCEDHYWCAEPLICRPENLSAALKSVNTSPADATCQPVLVTGEACPGILFDWPVFDVVALEELVIAPPMDIHYAVFDFCDADDFCDIATVPAGAIAPYIGTCLAAKALDASCDWCQERAFAPSSFDTQNQNAAINAYSDMWMFPSIETRFSSCGDEMVCDRGGSGAPWQGVCDDETSVCPFVFEDVYGWESYCGEICEPAETGPLVDEDHDGRFDCEDTDCCHNLATDCFAPDPVAENAPNIIGVGACAEHFNNGNKCDNGIDDDGDGLIDCGDEEADPPILPDPECGCEM